MECLINFKEYFLRCEKIIFRSLLLATLGFLVNLTLLEYVYPVIYFNCQNNHMHEGQALRFQITTCSKSRLPKLYTFYLYRCLIEWLGLVTEHATTCIICCFYSHTAYFTRQQYGHGLSITARGISAI